MIKGIILILGLIASVSLSKDIKRAIPLKVKTSNSSNISSIILEVTSSGNVPIISEYEGGSGVHVDFSDNAYESSDDAYSGDMGLALYTSNTMLSGGCYSFEYFSCSSYSSCSAYTSMTANASYPYFVAKGYDISTDIYLDYDHWSLSSYAILAQSCVMNTSSYYGSGLYGLIGMGFQGNAYNNFIDDSTTFSIYLDQDSSEGKLLFESDLGYAKSSNYEVVLSTDSNWHVSGVSDVLVGGTWVSTTSNLIFDMNVDTIGFPYSYYQQILTALEGYLIYCSGTSNNNMPSCSYYNDIDTLPNIYIYTSSGSFHIPPQVYATTQGSDSITLNIRALSSSLSGDNYVTPAYNNYIILGSNVMSYYYTVFDMTSSTITLYEASSSSLGVWKYVLIGVASFIALIICCVCCAKASRKRQVPKTGYPTSQAPLIANPEPAPYYQPSPAYNPYDPTNTNNYQQQVQGYGNVQTVPNYYPQGGYNQ